VATSEDTWASISEIANPGSFWLNDNVGRASLAIDR
jgi:hypothetical protein